MSSQLVSDFYQAMPQLHTVEQPMTWWEPILTAKQQQEHSLSKASSSLFLSKMIAKIEKTPRT